MASNRDTEERLKAALADRYEIEQEIGSGGMATVYLAQDLKHDRKVAVKVLKPELAAVVGTDCFLAEIRTTANLSHPHILPLHDSGEADGFLFYTMPYVEGESLRQKLDRDGQLPVEEAVQITREIADALAYAHEEGVIHRDVKPANIMLEAGHAVLADFGVAHAVAEAKDDRITRTGTSLGTPSYMSPEQATGERDLDGRSDQYALGCVLYEMLAGHPPFTGVKADAVIRQHITEEPPSVTRTRPSVAGEIAEVIHRALSKSPADRFRTTGELAAALALTTIPSETGPVRGSRNLLVGMGMAALAVLTLFLWEPWAGGGEAVNAATSPSLTILAEVDGFAPEGIRETVRNLIAGQIDESGIVITMSDEQIGLGLAEALRPDSTRITPELARELAVRGEIETYFAPELDLVGSTYALRMRAFSAERDSVLGIAQDGEIGEDELFSATADVVARLVSTLADRAGTGSLLDVQATSGERNTESDSPSERSKCSVDFES